MPPKLKEKTLAEHLVRFEKNFKKCNGCWEWLGTFGSVGYGYFYIPKLAKSSHRASYILYNGPIDGGLYVLHTCDNKSCVNPEHLFLGTCRDNVLDMWRKGKAGITMSDPPIAKWGKNHPEQRRGEMNNNSKLTAKEAREIKRKFRRTGYNQSNMKELALAYRVSVSQIGRIVRGTSWSH